jgi:hypothetical protein
MSFSSTHARARWSISFPTSVSGVTMRMGVGSANAPHPDLMQSGADPRGTLPRLAGCFSAR